VCQGFQDVCKLAMTATFICGGLVSLSGSWELASCLAVL
jgi:hypothetical protein